MAAAAAVVDHPYVPRDLHLPGFVPGVLSILDILTVYALSSFVGVFLVWILSGEVPVLIPFFLVMLVDL